MLSTALIVLAAVTTLLLAFTLGFCLGATFRFMQRTIDELRQELADRKAIEETPGSAVVDDSPQVLRAKKAERERRGEDEDDGESQIVNTRTPAQMRAATDAQREAKLDKWMPGVKHE